MLLKNIFITIAIMIIFLSFHRVVSVALLVGSGVLLLAVLLLLGL